jgi:hypothetical protein
VEVNMAAAEKQNNCDVTIHTDFGMVWDLSFQVSECWSKKDFKKEVLFYV